MCIIAALYASIKA